MSRSFRKNPILKYGGLYGTKFAKRYAAKAVRRAGFDLVKDGCQFKKFFPSWDIHDYRSRLTHAEWVRKHVCYSRGEAYMNPQEEFRYKNWYEDFFWK